MKLPLLIGGAFWLASCITFAQDSPPKGAGKQDKIAALQQQRIDLLQQRVSRLKELMESGLIDRIDMVKAEVDLLKVRLEYASSVAEKKKHLTELIKQHDQLISVAELKMRAPAHPGRQRHLAPSLSHLLLKAEKVRLQIELEKLQ